MANTWITDMTHFLDAEGRIAAQLLSRRLIHHLGSIVAAVTSESAETSRELETSAGENPAESHAPGQSTQASSRERATSSGIAPFVEIVA
ncbi:MAG: hypothetical protein O6948_09850 [Deltaproteobacteria bacterium]|nr:hypothetical protein [Deltaproteobacteria bacterium]